MDNVLTPEEQELIALSAAVASDCRLSFTQHLRGSLQRGVSLQRIEAVIRLAQRIHSVQRNDFEGFIIQQLAGAKAASDERRRINI